MRKSEAMTLPGTLWHDSNLRQVWATTQGSSEKRALFKRRNSFDSVAKYLLLYCFIRLVIEQTHILQALQARLALCMHLKI